MNHPFHPPLRRVLRPLAVLYLVLLLVLTHLPHPGHIPDLPGKDKTLHFIAYFLAAVLVLLGFLKYIRLRDLAGFVLGLLILGVLDEVTQPYIGRTCDLYDWLADLAGVVSGTILLVGLFRVQRGRLFNQ